MMGDGVLVEFSSAVNAAECAAELQEQMTDTNKSRPEARPIVLRIGIDVGDIIVVGRDLYGDGLDVPRPAWRPWPNQEASTCFWSVYDRLAQARL